MSEARAGISRAVLVRYGEIMLKGLNRHAFEERLAANIVRAVRPLGKARAEIGQGRIYVTPDGEPYDYAACARKAADVFGVVSASVAWRSDDRSEAAILACSETAMRERLAAGQPRGAEGAAGAPRGAEGAAGAPRGAEGAAGQARPVTFKVESKRGDKGYPLTSPEISRLAGRHLAENVPGLAVDVNSPEVVVRVEVRERVYAYTDRFDGFGGLPLGTGGKALLLLSGGIDSPVAGFMMAKRGVEVPAIHFHSHPYTSERAKGKAVRLAEILAGYFGKMELHVVPFTQAQLAIRDSCHEEYLTIVTRRAMMKIAQIVAERIGAQALVTGESMGQVASQTIMGLAATDCATSLPVFRPLIGMDKREVVAFAERIGTFETSILPFDDCCTVFTPKHPKTRPKLADVLREEGRVAGLGPLLEEAAAGAERIVARPAE